VLLLSTFIKLQSNYLPIKRRKKRKEKKKKDDETAVSQMAFGGLAAPQR